MIVFQIFFTKLQRALLSTNTMNYSSSRQAASSGSVSKPSHISDIISPIAMAIELTLVLLNVFPVIVVIFYKRRPRSRLAVDELILALSLTEIVGVLVPAPLGFTAYFSGEWKGGEIACNFYQVIFIISARMGSSKNNIVLCTIPSHGSMC